MAGKEKRVEAIGYMRTSSAANIGEGKDSEARQRRAIEAHAKAAGMVIVEWYYDGAVKGADPTESRPVFAALLARIAGNGVRTIIVETASRFARDLMVQEVGPLYLKAWCRKPNDLPASLLSRSCCGFATGPPSNPPNSAAPIKAKFKLSESSKHPEREQLRAARGARDEAERNLDR